MLCEGPANPHGALCARGLSCARWPGLACWLVESSKSLSLPNACCPALVLGPWTGAWEERCPLLQGGPWPQGLSLSTLGLQCSKSCGSGIRRRQVVCTIGPPGRCVDLQSSKPAEVEACNRQPCHLPQGTERAERAAPPCPPAACLVHTSHLGPLPGCSPPPLAIAAPAVTKSMYRSLWTQTHPVCRFRCHLYISYLMLHGPYGWLLRPPGSKLPEGIGPWLLFLSLLFPQCT